MTQYVKLILYTIQWCQQHTVMPPVDKFQCILFLHHHHNCFTALFPGPPRWAGAQKRTSGLYGARED